MSLCFSRDIFPTTKHESYLACLLVGLFPVPHFFNTLIISDSRPSTFTSKTHILPSAILAYFSWVRSPNYAFSSGWCFLFGQQRLLKACLSIQKLSSSVQFTILIVALSFSYCWRRWLQAVFFIKLRFGFLFGETSFCF